MKSTSSHCDPTGARHHPALRREAVPEAGRPFLGLAQRVGVFEDGFEAVAVRNLAESDRQALAFFRVNFPPEIDQWLRGDEAMAASPSTEYMAFVCLYLAADYVVQNVTTSSNPYGRYRADAGKFEWH